MSFQTEFEFELPRGYVDQNGEVHRHGVMRLATAADEIMPLRDPRVQQNPGYLTVILLSRVVTKLGTLQAINNRVIENLFTIDMAFLQDLYQRINMQDVPAYKVVCRPAAGFFRKVELSLYPEDKLYEEMTFLGYYLHWGHEELMNLEHRERRRWCSEVSQINKKLSGQKEKKNLFEK